MNQACLTLGNYQLPEEYPDNFQLHRLTGDASSRSYFRITGPFEKTIVLMKMPEAFRANEFPYLQNYELFRAAGVNLAEIYFMKPENGLVFLQDLGDLTFYELYPNWNSQQILSHYVAALEFLSRIEKIEPASTLTFDEAKFLWELNYFQQYFLEKLRGVALSQEEASELQDYYRTLCGELADQPRVFCHRDYHSRNLMVQNDVIYVIDFQDARFGPVTYDLASLVYDSYIQLPPEIRSELERFFFLHHPDGKLQRYEYPRMCLQRNLKALGTFGYQATILDRPFYLQFVAPTLGYIRSHFEKLPEYAGMRRLLAYHLPELS
jgi:N-acetylmuramate 1-kinase